jgi:hypothetical protein
VATALLVSIPVPESIGNPVAAALSGPPPDPQPAKLRAKINPKTQLKSLDEERGFFMAMACAFQGEVKTEDTKSLRRSTHCAAIEQNPACDFLTPALENVTFVAR